MGEDVETLRTELAETQARLKEAQGEFARLVRRPAAKDVAAHIARLVQLYREAAAASPNGAPVVGEDTMLRWLETSELFDRDFNLKCNGDVASAGADPTQHYFNHGYAEARPPSAL